jgi:hypothetical protein
MKVDVYDTYATGNDGRTIHFDVLVPTGTAADAAFQFACEWLSKSGPPEAKLKQSRCNFCHTENATPQMVSDIQLDGYHIIRMEGCPRT